jgi:uncharacterized protein (TIGR02147 family)
MVALAEDALDRFPIDERNISSVTMGISRPCYDVIVAELAAFKERIIAIVNNDDASSRVYQLNVQLYPLSVDTSVLKTHE